MKKQILKQHQFGVGHVEYSTGNVLGADLALFTGSGNLLLIFDSESEADNYMKQAVRRDSDIECWLQDSSGKHIRTLEPNKGRKRRA